MEWRRWSSKLTEALGLVHEPVAVAFAGALPEGAAPPAAKLSVCQALRRASEGACITLTADTCGCPGGLMNLGLGRLSAEGQERLADFLIGREHVYCSRAALHRSQQTVSPPLGLAPQVCFAPLSVATFLPDLVILLGRPGSLHRLIGLAGYWEGGALPTDLAGPACRTGITYPLATGNLGLSLLDFGARRLAGFAEDLLLISVPFHRMIGLMHALDDTATRAEAPAGAFEREVEALGPLERAYA